MLLLLAQESGGAASTLGTFLPLLLIGAFIWFFMIRPQRKRQQAVKEMQQALSVGDDVITVGGLHGRVDAIGDETVDLVVDEDEAGNDTVLRFKRSAVAEILTGHAAEVDQPADGAESA